MAANANLEAVNARLQAQLMSERAQSELRIEKKALEITLKMKAEVSDAHDKGFETCKKQFKELQELQLSYAAGRHP